MGGAQPSRACAPALETGASAPNTRAMNGLPKWLGASCGEMDLTGRPS
jgi:hypothetical protein